MVIGNKATSLLGIFPLSRNRKHDGPHCCILYFPCPRIFWFYFPRNSINVCSNQISSLDQQHLTNFFCIEEHIALLLSYLVSENPARKAGHFTDEAMQVWKEKTFYSKFYSEKWVQSVSFRKGKVAKVSQFPLPCISLAHTEKVNSQAG